ncbi:BQ2448_393 [Microbotryum intermedium]|uniref:BQ2448_393 protein n=1 Tax=Microbotryum intermedium TaxID=269621 RepID=A0A238F2B2_9BASI|nr:BQ2448_393 [Microbotryum intermedium]
MQVPFDEQDSDDDDEATALNPNSDSYLPTSKFSSSRANYDLEEASDRRKGFSISFHRSRLVCLGLAIALVLSLVSLRFLSPSWNARPELYLPPPPPSPRDEVILDLLNPQVYVKTGGASLLDREHVEGGPYSLVIPDATKWTVTAGQVFPVVIQCDADIIGHPPCAPEYIIYLRGPVAEAVPSIPSLYKHDSVTGRTEINVTVTQAGVYELWILPEGIRGDPNHPSCPDENRH